MNPEGQRAEPSWPERNWRWLVPAGCLGSLIIVAGFALLIVSLVFGVIRSSDIYRDAVASARSNKSVVERLGVPIEEGFLVFGEINITGSSGYADISIPVTGPRVDATIRAEATRISGRWNYRRLSVHIEGSADSIDLLSGNDPFR